MTPNLADMTNTELKRYIAKHRNDTQAFQAALEVILSRSNPANRYPPLSLTEPNPEVEKILRRKLINFLVIKHAPTEGIGIFEQFCRENGVIVDTVEIFKEGAAESLPDLDLKDYSALWVMGGPMNVQDEDKKEYHWLVEEKNLIRKAVQERLPYLGICLGAQLLADALGGKVQPMKESKTGALKPAEIGLSDVTLTEVGQYHPLMVGLPRKMSVLQWHEQEVNQLPPNAKVLATSTYCQVQAYAVGEFAFGLQFHSEATDETLEHWLQEPEDDFRKNLKAAHASITVEHLRHQLNAQLPVMQGEARIIFDNFLNIVKERHRNTQSSQ